MEDTQLIEMFIILVITIVILIITCVIKKIIDKKNIIGVETVEFYPPEGMNPARLGYILDGEVDAHDLIGLIIYMENKGYLRREIKNGIILLHRGNVPKGEKICVYRFYRYLFGFKLDTVALTGRNKFNTTRAIQLIDKNLNKAFSKKPVLDPRGRIIKIVISLIVIFLLLSTFIISPIQLELVAKVSIFACILATYFGAALFTVTQSKVVYTKQSTWKMRLMVIIFILLIIGFVTIFYVFMASGFNKILIACFLLINLVAFINFGVIGSIQWRNNEYADLLGKIKGFKNFLKYAEKDKIDTLVESDPQYFYKIIPYAYIFGVTDKWIKDTHAEIGEDILETEIKSYLDDNEYRL